jgi:hypothetical protein
VSITPHEIRIALVLAMCVQRRHSDPFTLGVASAILEPMR